GGATGSGSAPRRARGAPPGRGGAARPMPASRGRRPGGDRGEPFRPGYYRGHGRAALVHRRSGGLSAPGGRPVRAPRRLRDRPAGAGAEGVRRAVRAAAAHRHDRPEAPGGDRPRAGVSREAGDPPLPGREGRGRAGAGSRGRQGVRRRRLRDLARGRGRGRPEEAPEQPAGLRLDEGDRARRSARPPFRRRDRGAARARARVPGRRRLAAGAARLPGGEAGPPGRAPGGRDLLTPARPAPLRRLLVIALLAVSASPASGVVGGGAVSIQSAPWVVSIRQTTRTGSLLCSGAVLDPLHVLTAAHCVFDLSGNVADPGSLSVDAGASNYTTAAPGDAQQERGVSPFRVHPGHASLAFLTPADVGAP